MKKILFTTILILLSMQIFAQENDKNIMSRFNALVKSGVEDTNGYTINEHTKEALTDSMLYSTLANIEVAPEPFVYGESFVFVHKKNDEDFSDRVFIAFEHELYSKMHAFISLESNPLISVFLLPRTHINQQINYRIIINSMWVADPNNSRTIVDARGIRISSVFIPKLNPIFLPPVVKLNSNTMRFYLYMNVNYSPIRDTRRNLIDTYNQDLFSTSIFLVGTFTKWDPYLIQMKRVEGESSLYYADVPVSFGQHYYYYNVGALSFLDPHNSTVAKRSTGGIFVNAFKVTTSIEEATGEKTFVVSTKDIE